MVDVIFAILPIFLLILIGLGMRRWSFPGEGFWPLADRSVYFLFFPALLIHNLARADLGDLDPTGLFGTLFGSILLIAVIGYSLRRPLKLDGPAFTSLFQGSIRFNTFVGFGAVAALSGNAGITLYAVVISVAIPVLNVLTVLVMMRFGSHARGGASWRDQFIALAKNPLIIACLVGIFLNQTGIGLPRGIDAVLKTLGDVAAPLGLLTVGAALQLDALRRGGPAVAATLVLKLLLYPAAMFGLARLWHLTLIETQVLVLWAMLPTSSASYILARQMGGDAPLMAAIVTATTLGAFITMPILLGLMGL
ncbi:AEC family transporter [Ferrovibrio sp.]|uniref:AEC family transporter n=1 Tax=Ferrovibrio sp. TaxID=1917215 RepID=UPI003D0A5702